MRATVSFFKVSVMAVLMRDYVGPNGNVKWTCQVTGVVLRAVDAPDASTIGTGPGDIEAGGIRAPRVASSTATQHFLLHDAAGKAHFVEWFGPFLAARPGSRISVMWGGSSDRGTSRLLLAANLDTGETQPNSDGLTAFVVDDTSRRYRRRVCFVAALAFAISFATWLPLLDDSVSRWAQEVRTERVEKMAYPVPEVDQIALARAERRVDAARSSGLSAKQITQLVADRADAESRIIDGRERFRSAREREIPLELDVKGFLLTAAGTIHAVYLLALWLLACVPAMLIEMTLFSKRRATEFNRRREAIQESLVKLFKDGYSLRL